jgi:enoyl-CoA hydratase
MAIPEEQMTDDSQDSRYETILVERIGAVERITLNRPEKRNALSFQLQDELIHAVHAAERDKGVRVIVVRGAGSSFSGGYDLGGGGQDLPYGPGPLTVEEDVDLCISIGERWGQLWTCRLPVIAQVHGFCVAGGTDLALHCDMVVAADDAQLGFPPVRSQGGPPTHMWVYNAGPQWSKRLLLTGDTISGAKAAEIGLVLESVPADALDEHVLALATRVSHIGRDLLAHNKRIVNLGLELMGRSTMQTLAAIHDVLGHNAPEAAEFNQRLHRDGLRAAVADRDAPFAEA